MTTNDNIMRDRAIGILFDETMVPSPPLITEEQKEADDLAKAIKNKSARNLKIVRNRLDAYPESVLCEILLSLKYEDFERVCEISPRANLIFEKFEDRFPRPPTLTESVFFHMEAELKDDKVVLNCKAEPKDESQTIHFVDPSLPRIKRYIKIASTVSITVRTVVPEMFIRGTDAYKALRLFLESRNIPRLNLISSFDGPICYDILKMFKPSISLMLVCCTKALSYEPTMLFCKKNLNIYVCDSATQSQAERLFLGRQNHYIHLLKCKDSLPIGTYIEQWMEGTREIGSWEIDFWKGVDLGLQTATYKRKDGKGLLSLKVKKDEDGSSVVTLRLTCPPPNETKPECVITVDE